jgi:hypothetical protein
MISCGVSIEKDVKRFVDSDVVKYGRLDCVCVSFFLRVYFLFKKIIKELL